MCIVSGVHLNFSPQLVFFTSLKLGTSTPSVLQEMKDKWVIFPVATLQYRQHKLLWNHLDVVATSAP
jgi:hypothetical protein